MFTQYEVLRTSTRMSITQISTAFPTTILIGPTRLYRVGMLQSPEHNKEAVSVSCYCKLTL